MVTLGWRQDKNYTPFSLLAVLSDRLDCQSFYHGPPQNESQKNRNRRMVHIENFNPRFSLTKARLQNGI